MYVTVRDIYIYNIGILSTLIQTTACSQLIPDPLHHRVLLFVVQPGACALGAYTWFAW